jgi:hypothetical protein
MASESVGELETVVTDLDLSFCCMFTHEAGSLAEIQFWQREDS